MYNKIQNGALYIRTLPGVKIPIGAQQAHVSSHLISSDVVNLKRLSSQKTAHCDF